MKGNVKKAIDRLIAVQRFKECYGIKGDKLLAKAAHNPKDVPVDGMSKLGARIMRAKS